MSAAVEALRPALRRERDPSSAAASVDTGPAEAPGAPAPFRARVLHDRVPGRLRLGAAVLRGDEGRARRLERALRLSAGVNEARASALTGAVLVLFDAAVRPAGSVLLDVERLLSAGDLEDAPREDAGPAWHAMESSDVESALGASLAAGLSEPEARHRLRTLGPNAIPRPNARSRADMLLGQFRSLPVALLVLASAVSVCTGGALEAVAILGVVGLNGMIGYATEARAERTLRELGGVSDEPVKVLRGGAVTQMAAEGLVPGDLIVIDRGMVAPADARLVSADALMVSEAALTGESAPVRKTAEVMAAGGAALADRSNMIYRGSVVTGGGGLAVVVETGLRTEVGRIQTLVGESPPPQTPIQRQLDLLGRQIVWLSLAVSGIAFGAGWLRGLAFLQLFRSGLSLAVAAVPEGLPTVATTTLALGIEQMRRRGVIVRSLDAIETLASATVVCFDKTGTLTRNQMSVVAVSCGERSLHAVDETPTAADDEVADRLFRAAMLCSEATGGSAATPTEPAGSATEEALVRAGVERGIDLQALRSAHPLLELGRRSQSRRYMWSRHGLADGGAFFAVKGSPAEVLDLCAWEAVPGGGRRPLTEARRAAILRLNQDMANRALRVLGFADLVLPPGATADTAVDGLTWIGLAGLADPVRPEISNVIGRLKRAGVRTIVMTGDQGATARAVADRLGIGEGHAEIRDAGASDLDLAGSVGTADIFARVTPEQKLRVIRALQARGVVVAMVGDGINDSPALRAADVGIAIATEGDSAAAQAADVLVPPEQLEALVIAFERGRTTFSNVRKSIRYLLSTNGSEILLVLGALVLGLGEALSPMQLLWINLISDILPGLGLALEPPDPRVMDGRPSAEPAIVRRSDLPALGREALVISGGAGAACLYGALRYGAGSAQMRTMAFLSLVSAQLLHAITCRSAEHGLLRPNRTGRSNPALSGLLAGSVAVQACAFLSPAVRKVLGLGALTAADAVVTAAAGVAPYLVNEAAKAAQAHASRAPGSRGQALRMEIRHAQP